jgi:hypothetical protein
MSASLLRVILACLLLTTASVKVWGTRMTDPDIRPALVALLEHQGWPTHDDPDSPRLLRTPIFFEAPGCESPAQIFLIDLSLQMMPMLDRIIGPGNTRRIVYVGRTWPAEDRLGLRLEWLRHKVLSLFGIGRYVASSTALVVVEPPGCRAADLLDWSLVWDRQTLARVSTSSQL